MFLLKQGTDRDFGSCVLLLFQGINTMYDWKLATQLIHGFKNKILDPQVFLLLFKDTVYLEHSKYILISQKFNSFMEI